MRLRDLLLGLAVSAMAATSARAQISLSSAVDLALRNDPRQKMAQADVDKARAAISQAHDAYVPSIGASGGIGDSVGVPLSLPVIFSVSAQSLVFNFSQRDFIRSARAALDSAVLAKQEVHEQVLEDVVLTYIHLDNAERRRAAMVQEYGYAKRLVDIVQDRLDAGQDARIDLLRARRTADAAHLEQYQLDDEVASLSDHLARTMGMPGNQITTVPGSIPEIHPKDTDLNLPVSYGVDAAFANARSKQEKFFGDIHYWGRPQIGFGASYSRVSTIGTNYGVYYPAFSPANLAQDPLSLNALSLGIEVKVPIFDRAHEAQARQSAAEARRARYEAENQRNQFLEGRFKLNRNAGELAASERLAEDDQALAQDQVDTILIQLSSSSNDPSRPLMTPKDEQNARLQERERTIDLLNRQFELQQVQINLLRQTGQLDEWLHSAVAAPQDLTVLPVNR
jgi:outer membrane protein TolC